MYLLVSGRHKQLSQVHNTYLAHSACHKFSEVLLQHSSGTSVGQAGASLKQHELLLMMADTQHFAGQWHQLWVLATAQFKQQLVQIVQQCSCRVRLKSVDRAGSSGDEASQLAQSGRWFMR